MYQTTGDGWPEVSDDVELESDLLRGIAQYIANSADTAPVSMMAEQSISSSGKVTIEEDAGGEFIKLELSFDRAWASLARSLDVSGFEITDRNRSAGNYFVLYSTVDSEEKSGLFGWLGGGEAEHPAANKPLLVSMVQTGDERMEIRLAPEESGTVCDRDLQSLLQLIKGNIN
jgi:outer membrane protein assembly factor BamC